MSDVVAIVSVSASAVVGIGGLVSAYLAGGRERKWQSQEERIIEIRAVLEGCADAFTELMLAIGEAHHELVIGDLTDDGRRRLIEYQKQMWVRVNRIGVRRARSGAHVAANDFIDAANELLTIIFEAAAEGADSEREKVYRERWKDALDAHEAYLAASAQLLAGQQ